MRKLLNYLKSELSSDESSDLTIQQKVALKNIIEAARERVWISDPFHVGLSSDSNFANELSSETQDTIIESANVLERYLHKHTEQLTK